MAKKFTELTELAAQPAVGDLLAIEDISTSTTKKITWDNLIADSSITPAKRTGGIYAVVKDWGSGTGSASITGVPFAPQGFICFSTANPSNINKHSSGYAYDTGGGITQGVQAGSVGSSAEGSTNSTSACFLDPTTGGSSNFEAAVTSFNSDGITVNKTKASSTAYERTYHIIFFCG